MALTNKIIIVFCMQERVIYRNLPVNMHKEDRVLPAKGGEFFRMDRTNE